VHLLVGELYITIDEMIYVSGKCMFCINLIVVEINIQMIFRYAF